MFRIIKIVFNSFLIVLALIGFNAIGGQKYVEAVISGVSNFIAQHAANKAKSIGDFSSLHEEFQIDNTVNILGYKAVLAEHKISGQRMCIIDSGDKSILTQEDISGNNTEERMKESISKLKYPAVSFQDIKVISKGTISAYGQTVPYAKFEAKSNRFPISDLTGIVASLKTSDNAEKLIISVSEKKKYSQLIADEFFKNIKEN
jgi:hypothetical protein